MRFAEAAAAPPPAPPPVPPAPALGGLGGCANAADAKRQALTGLVTCRAKEIEELHRGRAQEAASRLVAAYQQQLARLQSELVNQLAELGRHTRQDVRGEIEALVQLGVPAIEHILAGSRVADGGGCGGCGTANGASAAAEPVCESA
jgi:hypothetical protein